MIPDLLGRVESELRVRLFLSVSSDVKDAYCNPLGEWDSVLEKFHVEDDVSEARRCLALDRPTASVFHMMRVLEVGVLALERFLGNADPLAHFGTVLGRLEGYLQKTPYGQLLAPE